MFIIGPPGSGKTATWKGLAKQESNEGNETVY
jgi:ATP-dependent Clp protease ATP-binding subunit ClpA